MPYARIPTGIRQGVQGTLYREWRGIGYADMVQACGGARRGLHLDASCGQVPRGRGYCGSLQAWLRLRELRLQARIFLMLRVGYASLCGTGTTSSFAKVVTHSVGSVPHSRNDYIGHGSGPCGMRSTASLPISLRTNERGTSAITALALLPGGCARDRCPGQGGSTPGSMPPSHAPPAAQHRHVGRR
jgi:hypothetical protein